MIGFGALLQVIGRPLAILAVVIGLYGAGRYMGATKASAACEANRLRAEISELKRRSALADRQVEAARKLADARAEEISILDERVAAYEREIKDRPGCVLDGADADRLRNIR